MSLLAVHAVLTFATWTLAILLSTTIALKWLAVVTIAGYALLFSRARRQGVWCFGASAGFGALAACALELRVSPEDDAVALIGWDSATAFYILTASSVLIAVTLALSGAWIGMHLKPKAITRL